MHVSSTSDMENPSECCMDVNVEDEMEDDRESWMYRSTQDVGSIGALDHDEWEWEDNQQEETIESSPKNDIDCKKKEVIITPQTTYRSTHWTTCVTPIIILPKEKKENSIPCRVPIISSPWILTILAGNTTSLFTAVFVSNDIIRNMLSISMFPRCSIILFTFTLSGIASFGGGIAGDLSEHRLRLVQRGIWLWCIASALLLLGAHPDVGLSWLYLVGVLFAFCASGCLLPNILVLGCPIDSLSLSCDQSQYFFHCGVVQLLAVSAVQCYFAAIPTKTSSNEWRTSSLEYIALAFTSVFFSVSLLGLHMSTYRRYLEPAPRLAGFGVYVSMISPLWKIVLGGFIIMIIGAVICLVSLLYSNHDSLYGGRFVHATIGISLVVFGWTCAIVLGVTLMNSKDVLKNEEDSSQERHETVKTLVPKACLIIFVTFVRGQLYTMYVLQACQCNMEIFGGVFNPEYMPVVTHFIALLATPIAKRCFKKPLRCFLIAVTLSLFASFISSIMELYRRSSTKLDGRIMNAETCHKDISSFNVIWTIPQVILLGVSESILYAVMMMTFHERSPPSFLGMGQGILALSEGIGYATSIGLASLASHWFEETTPSDLVIVFLLVTSMGCVAFACLKRSLQVLRSIECSSTTI